MKITRAEAALIRSGFSALERDRFAAARSFYAHLFAIAPETRALFVVDLERQGVKLMNTLAVVVDQVENWGLLRTSLDDLALRHTAYGVRPEHYALTGAALQATLRDCLGPKYTPQMASAWQRVYDEIQKVMIETAYPKRAEDPI
jgi:hemoglobin-like flavoprotein